MSVTYPALLFGGAALALVPILIHLLNKRKFKVVDWAATDFLFEADKKNRRRVQLEDLLILLLRVAAVLLLVALLARPYLSSATASVLGEKAGFDRIVLLDDSPSMEAQQSPSTPLKQARSGLMELVRALAQKHSSDTLTVLTTSQPKTPVVREAALTPETVGRLTSDLTARTTSSRPANYEDALSEVEELVSTPNTRLNRLVYVISDLRQADWSAGTSSESEGGAVAILRRLADKTAGCYLVNVGGSGTGNLAITSLRPVEKILVAGQACRFEAIVRNYGPNDVDSITVKVSPQGSLPVEGQIEKIPAGQNAALPVTLTFARPEDGKAEPVPLRAELAMSADTTLDRLAADNLRYYPARVVDGVATLLVDGDAAVDPRRSETFYLRRGLAPPGDLHSGILPRVVAVSEFETLDLDPFQVIYLTNVDRLSDARRASLEQWVRRGGGLVIVLGDQLADLGWFNSQMFRGGDGLSPAEVVGLEGDETGKKWALLDVVAKGHEVVSLYEGENNPFLEGIKVFRWWQIQPAEKKVRGGQTRLLVRLTDENHAPLAVEHGFGDGKVMLLTTPLDADWSTWPQDHASYVLFVQFLTRWMAHSTVGTGLMEVGEQIKVPLDVTSHKMEAALIRPSGDPIGLHPVQDRRHENGPQGESQAGDKVWHVSSRETDEPGIYRVKLPLHEGGEESVLFAANIASAESNLAVVEESAVREQFEGSHVTLIRVDALVSAADDGAKAEWWLSVLGALGMVLGAEQALAWLFGRKR